MRPPVAAGPIERHSRAVDCSGGRIWVKPETEARSATHTPRMTNIVAQACYRFAALRRLRRRLSIEPVQLRHPGRIGHIGPVIGVDARRGLKQLAVNVQDKLAMVRVKAQPFPWHREQLTADTQNAPKSEQGVQHPAGG